MKLSLTKIMESFFQPEAAKNTKNCAPGDPKPKGPSNFPYGSEDGETLSDEEIDQELKLELKLSNVMRDPLNLPNHNAHNGSFSAGKGSRPFGNYQTTSKQHPEKSQVDVMVQPIEETHDPEQEEVIRKELGRDLIDRSSRSPEEMDAQIKQAIENRDRAREQAVAARKKKKFPANKWEEARSPIKPIDEDVGMREKGRAYGAQITTKQPFASGMPKTTGSDFMDEDEIGKELGLIEGKFDLMEWISSSPILNRRAHGPEAELDFFDKARPLFTLNTEEEFNANQRKLVGNGKTKKAATTKK